MGFRVIIYIYIKDQSIVTDAGLAQPAGEAPIQDWLASFAAQQNLQRLADTLGQRPLTPLGDVGVAGLGFRVWTVVARASSRAGSPKSFTPALLQLRSLALLCGPAHPTQSILFLGLGFFLGKPSCGPVLNSSSPHLAHQLHTNLEPGRA